MFEKSTIDRACSLLFVLTLGVAGCSDDVLTPLGSKTDQFTQNAAAMVDILWIVDNSGSMAQEQEGLGESFNSFILTLLQSGVDYHIGVISTDADANNGRLHTGPGKPLYIDPSLGQTAAAQAFLSNVTVGTSGSPLEKGFEAAALALGKGIGQWEPGDPEPVALPNPNFLRRGICQSNGTCEGVSASCTVDAECQAAALFLIFVSDEDDKSFGPVDYYLRLFESYKGAGNEAQVKLSAIVGPANNPVTGEPGGCVNLGRGAAAPGDRYADLVIKAGGGAATGVDGCGGEGQAHGVVADICQDFSCSLNRLSITAAGLSSRFKLSSVPNLQASSFCDPLPEQPMCVRVNGEAVQQDTTGTRDGWTYEPVENAVVFGVNVLPPPQATITVNYQGF